MDQLSAQILVAALADPQELRLAAGGELLRNQTQPGSEIAAALEAFRLTDDGYNSRRHDRADAGDRRQSTSLFVLLRPADELRVESPDPPVEFGPLRASVGDEQKPAPSCSSMRTIRNCSSFRLP